jgi:hypothetical protein
MNLYIDGDPGDAEVGLLVVLVLLGVDGGEDALEDENVAHKVAERRHQVVDDVRAGREDGQGSLVVEK